MGSGALTRHRVVLAAALLVSALAIVLPVAAGATRAGNFARAQREAPRLLGMLHLPPNATASPAEPSGDHGVLSRLGYDEATPNLIDAHAWSNVPGKAGDVLAYVAARVPRSAKPSGSASGNIAPGYASKWFSLGPIAGVLSERVLAVTVVQLNRNTTGVRIDGEAVWIVPRPGWERIPSGARRVIVTARRPAASGRPGPWSAPSIITGSRARDLVAFVNRLGIVQPGLRSCPAAFPEYVRLLFLGSHGQTVARAVEQPTGCASVSLTIGSRRGPPLSDYPSITRELRRIGVFPAA